MIVLSLVTDEILHLAHVSPPWDAQFEAPGLNALAHRCVYNVIGAIMAARLAPRNVPRHLWVFALSSLPCTWIGALIYRARSAAPASAGRQEPTHQQPVPKPGLARAGGLETTRPVEGFGVRIADHVQRLGAALTGALDRVADQYPPNAAAPAFGFHKERIKLGVSVRPWNDGREADDRTGALRHEDLSRLDLLDGHVDRLGVEQERVVIAWIAERCASLQGLEKSTLGRHGRPDVQRLRHVRAGPARSSRETARRPFRRG